MASPDAKKIDSNEIVILPLSDIFVDSAWNSRLKLDSGSGGPHPEDEQSLEGLQESIKVKGQDEPVVVRLNTGVTHTDGTKSKHTYSLVCGFRRCEAIRLNAADKDGNVIDKNPTVRAVVRILSDKDARELNLRENTARDSLNAPDVAFGIQRLLFDNPNMTQGEISAILGKSQSYISRLMVIAGCQQGVFADWRKSGGMVGIFPMMSVAKLPKGEQRDAYDALVKEKTPAGDDAGAKVKSAKERAIKFGSLMASLANAELIEVTEELFTGDNVHLYVTGVKDFTEKQLAAIGDAAGKAFDSWAEEQERAAKEAARVEAHNAAEKAKSIAAAKAKGNGAAKGASASS